MPKNEKIIDYLTRKLNTDYKRKISMLAREENLKQSTLSRIARGEITNPTLNVVQPLLDRIQADEAKKIEAV